MSALSDRHHKEILERDLENNKLKIDLKEIKDVLQEKIIITAEKSKSLLELKCNLDTFEKRLEEERRESKNLVDELRENIYNLRGENLYLQAQLSSAKKNSDIETANIQNETFNKAELSIVELPIKINCLEAEKSSLALQLEEANRQIDALKLHCVDKDRKINSLIIQKNIAVINYEDSRIQIEILHEKVRKYGEEQKLYNLRGMELTEAEEQINDLQTDLTVKQAELESLGKR